jgi:hypothetical protein
VLVRYLQRAAAAAFLLTLAALAVFWTVKDTRPSGSAVLPILYAVLAVSAVTWLATERTRLRQDKARQRSGKDEMNRLIRRQCRSLQRRPFFQRLLRKPVGREQRLMETNPPPPQDFPPAARSNVGHLHEQHLHRWLTGIAQSISQGKTTGYAGFPEGADQDRKAIAAHFPDLIPRLAEWEKAVARAEAAPIAARKQVEQGVLAANIPPEYNRRAIAEIIARFITVSPDYRIVLRAVRDDFRKDGVYWSVFTASGRNTETKIAVWDDAPIESILQRSGEHEAELQLVVDSVRDSGLIPEISASQDALEALKQPLLNLLRLKQAVSPILAAADCSYCEAQLQAAIPMARV